MPCNCSKTIPLPCCITNLTVGVGDPDTDYIVYFKTATGRTDNYPATSDVGGNIIVTDTEFRIGEYYECWITLADAENINDSTPFSIGEIEVQCLNVIFQYAAAIVENQTVTLV